MLIPFPFRFFQRDAFSHTFQLFLNINFSGNGAFRLYLILTDKVVDIDMEKKK